VGVAAGDVARTRPENKQNNNVRRCRGLFSKGLFSKGLFSKGLFSASAATGRQEKPTTNLAADESKNAAATNGGNVGFSRFWRVDAAAIDGSNVGFSRDGRGDACVPSEWVEG
jgi:hypothetical protein